VRAVGPGAEHAARARRGCGKTSIATCIGCHDREQSPRFDYYPTCPRWSTPRGPSGDRRRAPDARGRPRRRPDRARPVGPPGGHRPADGVPRARRPAARRERDRRPRARAGGGADRGGVAAAPVGRSGGRGAARGSVRRGAPGGAARRSGRALGRAAHDPAGGARADRGRGPPEPAQAGVDALAAV
jgi:hypothetical protein